MPLPVKQSTSSLAKTLPRAKVPVMNLGPQQVRHPSNTASNNLVVISTGGPQRPQGKYGVKGQYGIKLK